METLAKIFSVPEITNMPPTRRVHSFSANGSGMKLLKPIPFETSRFPEWGTPFSHLLFKLENFRTRFSTPGLASERNRITCCIFVGQDRKRSRDYNQTRSSFDLFKCSKSKVRSKISSGFEMVSRLALYREGSVLVGRIQPRFLHRWLLAWRCYGKTFN